MVNAFSREAGVPINLKKSDGINLLSKEGLTSEISSKENFNFLGYAIAVDKISVKNQTVKRIKKQISYILYRNLIQPLKTVPLGAMIIPANDRRQGIADGDEPNPALLVRWTVAPGDVGLHQRQEEIAAL
jgi:RNA-directed DNA polymerase